MSKKSITKGFHVIDFYYIGYVKSSEFMRWLKKQGATFSTMGKGFSTMGKGSHQRVYLKDKVSIFPNHPAKEMPVGTMNSIKKDLGLK